MYLFAKLMYPNSGHSYDKEQSELLDMGAIYRVKNIDMGISSTSFTIDGCKGYFNAIQFEFYDENFDKVDIYTNPKINHYIKG